jgi:DNA-binding MarR family transcriptional regulator
MNESIAFLLNDAARLYRRAFNARVREDGFTALQWRLMLYLRRIPGIRQGPLAELIEVEPITLSRMVDRLQESGFVERRADPQDRRAWQLYLTEKALNLLQLMRPITEELDALALHGLTAEEQATLFRLAGRVHQNLSMKSSNPDHGAKQADAK